MAIKPYIVAATDGAEPTFINGSLHPPGSVVHVDLDELNGTAEKPETSNLVPLGKKAEPTAVDYEVAAIAPTGPNPTAPQSLPPGAVQQGEAFIVPGTDGEPAARAVAEKADDGKPKRRGS